MSIGTLQCSEGGRVESEGGNICVDSLQGSAELLSAGGDIQVSAMQGVRGYQHWMQPEHRAVELRCHCKGVASLSGQFSYMVA